MKVLVCGSRSWMDEGTVYALLGEMRDLYGDELEVLHGAAPGADTMADRACLDLGIRRYPFPPDSRRPVPQRFHERNDKMLKENPNLVLAFWDGRSNGTKSVIEKAKRRGIKVLQATDPLWDDLP